MKIFNRSLLGACFLFVFTSVAISQIVSVIPAEPVADDTITVIFDATQGNQALKGHSGPVYMHTGVIIGTADEPSGWRYVQGEWGTDDARMRLQKIGPDRYQIRYHIRSFYGIPLEDPFLQLSFVFRNQNGSIVAKDIGEADIYYPKIEVFEHGPLEKANGTDGDFMGRLEGIRSTPEGRISLISGDKTLVLWPYSEQAIGMSFYTTENTDPRESKAIIAHHIAEFLPVEPHGLEPSELDWKGGYTLRIKREPIELSLWQEDKLIWQQEKGFFFDSKDTRIGPVIGLRSQIASDEHLYGTGSRAIPIDRRGERLYAYNTASYGYTLGEIDLNISIPYVLSSKGYGLFFDSYRRGYFDLGQSEEEVFEFGTKDTALDCILIFGDQPAELVQEYTRLTGYQPLPPRWALGYIQSRFGYKSQEEAEKIVSATIDAGFPLDATLMDLYWFGGKERMGDLDWDRLQFSQPEKMIANFLDKGVKTILITETYFVKGTHYFKELDQKGFFTKDKNGNTFLIPDFWAGPAALLDVQKPGVKEWLWTHFQKQIDAGVAGWWSDSGEPENHPLKMQHFGGSAEEIHNLYASEWSRILYEQNQYFNANQRFFNLARSGYAGMQRYATFPWSGDVSRSWDAFRAQPMIMLGAGLNGISYMHSDLGGFTGGPKDPELYRRWLQMGAFVPIMRVHGDATGIEPEPIFYDAFTREVVKKSVQLRYQFLPYNYQLAYQNSQNGDPLARPLWYHFPKDSLLKNLDNSYLWGPDILVMPVFEAGITSMKRYFPKEHWYDFYTDARFEGGIFHNLPLSQERMPLFVRAGAFLPLYEKAVSNSSQIDGRHFDLHYYLAEAPSEAELFWDDGESTETKRANDYQLIRFKAAPEEKNVRISIWDEHSHPTTGNQSIRLVLHGLENMPRKIKVDGKKYTIDAQDSRFAGTFSWNPDLNQLSIHLPYNGGLLQLDIKK